MLKDSGQGVYLLKSLKETMLAGRDAVESDILEARAEIYRRVRLFFDERGYLELDTPLLSPDLIPETCLEVFKTEFISAHSGVKPRELYLIPSPEIWMKRVIADTGRSVYQICKCFRNYESTGRMHNPEFTMLEYYTMNAGYLDSLAITEELFGKLLNEPLPGSFQEAADYDALRPPFVRLTMEEAFCRYAGFSLNDALAAGTLAAEAGRLGLNMPPGTDDGTLYNLIFIHAVEGKLHDKRPVVLLDYPAAVPCLAALNPAEERKSATRQRWELYVRGIETANCYTEETDAAKINAYFKTESELKRRSARVIHHIDAEYWKIFLPKIAQGGHSRPFPCCSGVAIGMDRLIMVLLGRTCIDAVLPFQSVFE
ncbi:MAG: LysR family transcriptional regulator [Spirochaetaceae bacterium]|jgi:lysyl-tRNA synthetase class 2|nr:LysR family transcriptional regulator [Spirochaetaceae bacterium]